MSTETEMSATRRVLRYIRRLVVTECRFYWGVWSSFGEIRRRAVQALRDRQPKQAAVHILGMLLWAVVSTFPAVILWLSWVVLGRWWGLAGWFVIMLLGGAFGHQEQVLNRQSADGLSAGDAPVPQAPLPGGSQTTASTFHDRGDAPKVCTDPSTHRWERRRDLWWFWVPASGAMFRRACSNCHTVERRIAGRWRDAASIPWWLRVYPAAMMVVLWAALAWGLVAFPSVFFVTGPGLLGLMYGAPSWVLGLSGLALAAALIGLHCETGDERTGTSPPQRGVGLAPEAAAAKRHTALPANTQPRFHWWRDAGKYRWLAAVLVAAGVGWVAVGTARIVTASPEGGNRSLSIMPPNVMVGVGLAVMFVSVLVSWAAIQYRQETMTGRTNGSVQWGYDPDGQHTAVTHIRSRSDYPRCCSCDLFHSDAEAQEAGYTYSEKVWDMAGIGWSGLITQRDSDPARP